MADGLYDIFAIEQNRLASEARTRGDTKAAAIHGAQADRFWTAQRKHDTDERKARDTAQREAEHPGHQMRWERKDDAEHDMYEHVHLFRGSTIICHDRLFEEHEHKSVEFKPEMEVDRFVQAYRNTTFYQRLRKNLCPSCLIEARMIRKGIVE